MANNVIRLIALRGHIPTQTDLVEFTSVHFLKRRTSLTIIPLFSYLFQCYLMQHKRMQIKTMEILRLKCVTFGKSLTLLGPQFRYLYNYRSGLGDFEGLCPMMVCNYITKQFDKIILFVHTVYIFSP